MTGTILNALGILLGGIVGVTATKQISSHAQALLKILLASLVVYAGLSMTWRGFNGSFGQVAKQFGIMLLALSLGNFTGHLLGLQRGLNRLGRFAKDRFARSGNGDTHRLSEGFITCTLVFCVGPMAILGALEDGLNGNFKILALKAVMDGLATVGFAATFGWGVMLSAIPVIAYQGTITLLARSAAPYLGDHALLDSISATGGLLVFCIALIILELKKVELANYLPSLIYAPLLTWWWR